MKAKIQLLRDHNAICRGARRYDAKHDLILEAVDAVCKQAERYEYLCSLPTVEIVKLRRRAKVSGVRFSVLMDEMMEEINRTQS